MVSSTRLVVALLAFVALVGLHPAGARQARAQSAVGIPQGSLIRLRVAPPTAGKDWIRGRYLGTDQDSLRLTDGTGETVGVPLQGISRLDVSRGRHTGAGKGALIGGGVGVGFGLALGAIVDALAAGVCESANGCDHSLPLALVVGGAAGGAVGAGVGALVGSLFHGERWTPVPLKRPTVGVIVAPNRIGMQISLRRSH